MKKRIKKIIVFMICIISLSAGCGKKEAKQPVKITIWHVYGGQTDSPLNDLIDTFNSTVGKKEGIQLQVTMVSNNNSIHEDIIASANNEPGATELPDIFVAYPKTIMAMPDENILVDFREYFEEEELAAFVPEFLEDGTVNGRLVSLPVAKSTELLFVNKTAFDRFSKSSGVKLSDLKTWEGLFRAAGEYAKWTDEQTPDTVNDGKAFFVHDFHFNYFQVGVESLGEEFFKEEKIAFGPAFENVWEPYARAALLGGLWLKGGYATEPLRTGESIVSVASSASVLYFSNEVIYADNTAENIELAVLPCPVFENGEKTVMQRGAGMCVVKSTPEREMAAVTFLKWLTEPERNTEFAVEAGYMPVLQEAFTSYLPQKIEGLTEQKYVALYEAFLETQAEYEFYTAPQLKTYLDTETAFEENIRRQLLSGRNAYLKAEGEDSQLLEQLVEENLRQFENITEK